MTPGATSTPRPTSPTSPTASPTRHVDGTKLVTFDDGPPGPVALDGDTLAFPFADESDSWNTVRISRAGVVDTVARSQWDEGLINWVALADGWLAYVDQSHTQGDGAAEVLWRVWALDLSSGERRLLADNGQVPDPYVPVVRAGGGFVFWAQAEPDRSARELVWRPDWDEPRPLLTFAELAPGTETYSNGAVVYLGPNAQGLDGHTTGGDCWRAPIDGGPPEAITHTALAMGCAASGHTLI